MLTYRDSLRLEPVRIGVRSTGSTPDDALASAFTPDPLTPGTRRVGPLDLTLSRVDHGDAATFGLRVENPGKTSVEVDAVCLGFQMIGAEASPLRYLKNGWQSWSYTGTRELDDVGEPPFAPGPWVRGMYDASPEPPPERSGWHESSTVTVVGGGSKDGPRAVCLAGVFEKDCSFGVVYLRPEGAGRVSVEVELRLELPLAPGEARTLDDVRVALGQDPNELLEAFATLWGRSAGARTASPSLPGWCSWYQFFHDVDESDLLRNVEALANARDEIPVDVIQLDDGYQRAIGDWLQTNEKFPRGLAHIAQEIRDAGFRAGLWTAPLAVVAESDVYRSHPEWLLQDPDGKGPFRGTVNETWTRQRFVHALDTTQPAVLDHLESLFRELTGIGFTYHKLDFLHVGAMQAKASRSDVTRAARLRAGLEAIRRGAGDDGFLLGCGCPIGPAVGVVDAMRIGPDVAPRWHAPDEPSGLSEVLPSTASAVRSTLHRAWMHRRLFVNDPDCLMTRSAGTELSLDEARTLAATIASTAGRVVLSDDVPAWNEGAHALARAAAIAAAEADASGQTARVVDLLARSEPGVLRAPRGLATNVCLVNRGEEEWSPRVTLETLRLPEDAAPKPLLGTTTAEVAPGRPSELSATLGPHESAFAFFGARRPLVIFCDFDGTFSLQDVGSTLAKRHLPDRRKELWKRYEAGELTPWKYTHLLLDGLELPSSELDAFLRTIELDPGSVGLVDWCRESGVPFRILSDGFGRNLEVLKRLHRVEFFYYANRLHYEGDRWRVGAGYPDDICGCGTGTCKGTLIASYRAAHPGAFCVHIGNGRVSDLCGAREADLAFARRGEADTLGPALEERGLPFEWFDTLHDVTRVLEALVA